MDKYLTAKQSLNFVDFGITKGMQVSVNYVSKHIYPSHFTGMVEAVYSRFAVIKVSTGYRTTIHIGDITGGLVKIGPAVSERRGDL